MPSSVISLLAGELKKLQDKERALQAKAQKETEELKKVEEKKDMIHEKEEVVKKVAPAVSRTSAISIKELSSFSWDQDSKKVSIYISDQLNGVGSLPKEQITCTFEKRSFDLKVIGLNGFNYGVVKSNLEKEIDVSASKMIVKADRIKLVLVKKEGGHWMDLVEKKKKIKEPVADSKDPSAGLMDLMKNLYEGLVTVHVSYFTHINPSHTCDPCSFFFPFKTLLEKQRVTMK
jgi:hypothetical protein